MKTTIQLRWSSTWAGQNGLELFLAVGLLGIRLVHGILYWNVLYMKPLCSLGEAVVHDHADIESELALFESEQVPIFHSIPMWTNAFLRVIAALDVFSQSTKTSQTRSIMMLIYKYLLFSLFPHWQSLIDASARFPCRIFFNELYGSGSFAFVP